MIITKQTKLETIQELGSECTRCNSCCRFDSGIVLNEDIPRIAKYLGISSEKLKNEFLVEHDRFNTNCFKFKLEKSNKKDNKPFGQCIMLDEEKGCKIHDVKPLHCRVCSPRSKHGEDLSQWFALNYLVNLNDSESIRQWASFLHTNNAIVGGELKDLVPDKVKLQNILSYEVLK